ncbi:MAG: DNA repair protein RecO [Alphaproteobacteria bacterium]|nr:MAG: DNA repair protein RecO [Alphaproteobacteria bacterium]
MRFAQGGRRVLVMSLRNGQGLVLAVKPFGERDALVELLCAERGRMRGLVKGGRGTRGNVQATLQPFNGVGFEHFRRLEGQLGTLNVEMVKSRAHVWMGVGAGAFVVPYLSELLAGLLPEEHPYEGLHTRIVKLLESACSWRDLIAFELWLLDVVGYGLRLRPEEGVAGEGSGAADWAYVSPASGRVVDKASARGYEARLLPLPMSLGGPDCNEVDDFAMAWRLSGYFIDKALHGGTLASRGRLGVYYGKVIGHAHALEAMAA